MADELAKKFEERAKMMRLAGGQSRLDKAYAYDSINDNVLRKPLILKFVSTINSGHRLSKKKLCLVRIYTKLQTRI